MKDAVVLLKLGRLCILKALLHLKSLFASHDALYILDQLYISDYCIWIQKASDNQLKSLASAMNHFKINKEIAGWNLEALEAEALQRKANGEF
jgi:protein SHQ1